MTQNVRLWEVSGEGELAEIRKTRLATEKQLEDWLEADINVLGDKRGFFFSLQTQTLSL